MNCIVSRSSTTGFGFEPVDINDSKNCFSTDFVPGSNDVLIGRGKKCSEHAGNKRLRHLVASKLEEYSAATSKKEKTKILLSIVSQIRTGIPEGGFIKLDPGTGQWFEVGDFLAREKVSQTFRDALHEDYRSSNEFKKKRKREQSVKGYSSMQSSKRSRSSIKPSTKQEEQPEINWTNDDLSNGLTLLDFESSMEMDAISRDTSELQCFLPDSSFLTSWFEDEINPFEPSPISPIPPKDVEVYEPLPLPKNFDKFLEEMDINNDFIPIFENKVDKINDQSRCFKAWNSHPKRSISDPSRNSCAARTA